MLLPATPEVIAAFVVEAEAAPEELSAIANIMVAPPMPEIPEPAHGKPIVMALLCWAPEVEAGEIESGERAVARFRRLATLPVNMVRPMPYPEMYQFTKGPGPDHEAARSLFLDAVELPTAEAILGHLRASTAPLAVAQLWMLGGAMALATADSRGWPPWPRGSERSKPPRPARCRRWARPPRPRPRGTCSGVRASTGRSCSTVRWCG
jgi:hypothetical protein